MVTEHVIDTRELVPPEPLLAIMAAVRDLGSGECIRMRHGRLPYPLFASLAEIGFAYRVVAETPVVEVLIWRAEDAAAEAVCGPGSAAPDVPPGRCP